MSHVAAAPDLDLHRAYLTGHCYGMPGSATDAEDAVQETMLRDADSLRTGSMTTTTTQRISPCLWFDHQAEEAARFYTGIFPNSRVTTISRYGDAGQEIHGMKPGSVMVAAFELDGQEFTALNGGPVFQFNEAISLQVFCDTQEEVDHYWEKLGAGGDPKAQQCGWLKDKYGVSWQVVPRIVTQLMSDADRAKADRVMAAVLPMKKIDIAAVERAAAG